METLLHIDWKSMFVPSISLAEIFIRGTMIYLFIFLLLRVLRRDAGALGIADLLMVVLVADAAQNAMASEYKSVTEGAVLVATIGFWNYFLDWLGYKSPWFQRVLRPTPLLLIKNGQLQRRNLQKEMITKEELIGQLREQGVESPDEVKKCYLEGDGHISVIKKDGKKNESKKQDKSVLSG
ncbi:MAG: DUF421 domain-containing protein [Acidobacteriota bacterium]|nr:DUF421 domain-containing protein [Acidobacteriota bacterium]